MRVKLKFRAKLASAKLFVLILFFFRLIMVVECLILSLVLHICISYVLFSFQLCFLSYVILELSRIAVLDTIDLFRLKNR